MKNSKYDVCIVGAGVAGCALGYALAKQGRRVAVVERDLNEPDKFIGELLQPGGVDALMSLGFPADIFTDIDSPKVVGYALFKNGIQYAIPYASIAGRTNIGQGFRYGKFIGKLRNHLNSIETVTLIEGKVIDLKEPEERVVGIEYLVAGSSEKHSIDAPLTVVSDGGYSSFRKDMSNTQREIKSYMLALLLEDCELPFPAHGHVFIAENPFLAYPVSSTKTRMLIDFPADAPPKKGEALTEHLMTNIRPHLPQCMHPSFDYAVKNNPFKAMPSCEIPADPVRKKGAILLGDSLNMRHPITGGGMTVAFTDVKFLSDLLSEINAFSEEKKVEETVEKFYSERHHKTSTINILANALYKVLSHDSLSEACFNYLRKGGKKASEPIQLLGGISNDRNLLISHFMGVAKSGAINKLKPIPTPSKIRAAQGMISDAINIIEPQLKNEHFGSAINGLMKVGKFAVG